MLTIEAVTRENAADFVAYCRTYGPQHDESYLPEQGDIPTPDQPSYLLMRRDDLVGAVSLLRQPRFMQIGKGRFAILHSLLNTPKAYSTLLNAVRPHFDGLHSIYLFLPQTLTATAAILRQLGFAVERYSYVLVHSGKDVPSSNFPDGFRLMAVKAEDSNGLRLFADLINRNFSHLAGHTHATIETIGEMFSDPGYFPGGIALLMEGEKAVGTLAVMREYDNPNAAEIMAFSLAKEYRGRGLGRALLRAAMHVGLQAGLKPIYLSVNAENEGALQLYLSQGFHPQETMVCYALELPSS
jgi:mycothiol synthase